MIEAGSFPTRALMRSRWRAGSVGHEEDEVEGQQRRSTTDRSPLVLIVILVYAAFLVTALASIMLFFPQASLPGSLRLPSLKPAVQSAPAASAAPVRERADTEAPSALARVASSARLRLSNLEWPEIKAPDLGGWARGAVSSVKAWLAGLEWPDVAGLWRSLWYRSAPTTQVATPAPARSPLPPAAATQAPTPSIAAAPIPEPVQPRARPATAPAATASPASPDIDALRRSYEGRLREAEAVRARDVAAAAAAATAKAAQETERRFNPMIDGGRLTPALARDVNRGLFGADVSAPYRDVLAREGIASREQYEALRARAAELDALTGRLLEVPYTNSVPPALEHIRDAGQTLALEYGRIWSQLADRLETRDHRIARLEAQADQFALAMDSLARTTREGGYVLDPRDPQSIVLYISRLHAPRVGDTVYVFRSEDELLATLRITAVGDTVRASLVERGETLKPIAAFDRILLAASEEKKG